MTFKKLIVLPALLGACVATPTAMSSDCGALGPCVSQGGIAVLAAPDIARPILSSARQGAIGFNRYFGVDVTPIAIVPGGEITAQMQEVLKGEGYNLSLPWISASDKKTLAEANIRRQILEQTKGLPPEQKETIMKMALAKSAAIKVGAGDMSATEQGALTHELGHYWFMAAFKPEDAEKEDGHGYGGWAPDWLDETAAVLLENETLTAARRKAFKEMNAEDFYPLAKFLTMEHPALKSAQTLKDKFGDKEGSGGSRAIVLSGEEAAEFLKASGEADPANFYTQVRGFADYVIKATGDEQIFANLAAHLSQGESFESWLTKTNGLPDNLPAFTQGWNVHLSSR